MELHPHEIRILKELKKRSTPEEIANKAGIPLDAVMRASSWLATKELVRIEEKIIEEISLGKEGLNSVLIGLPERNILRELEKEGKNEYSISKIQKKFDKETVSIGLGWLKKKNLARLDRGRIRILNTKETEDEKLLRILKERERIGTDELTEELSRGLEILKKRKNLIKISKKRKIWLIPTGNGIKLGEKAELKESISQLTPEIILSRKWKSAKLRPYDVDIYVNPKFPAKRHPLVVFIESIREIFVGMGFCEISGPLVESAFWNFDSLFVPQDHPARDMHDTFYLKNPKEISIYKFDEFRDNVKKTHENGWITGSNGWGYKWSEDIAKKPLLRTHTTTVTARYLSKLKKDDLPSKVFCIGKTFRNEAIDYKHLPEFYQVEGIVVDENANFRNLLGILREFYDEMGFKLRFRPAYFPYTEMSVEPEVYIEERNEWIEMGGAGIFRPEVVIPLLGFECPVLAWGLGLDRLVALKLGLSDIRELYISDLEWLRKSRV